MNSFVAPLLFVVGAALVAWAATMEWGRRRWLRSLSPLRAELQKHGTIVAEELHVAASIVRHRDRAAKSGRVAVFLIPSGIWIEMESPRRGMHLVWSELRLVDLRAQACGLRGSERAPLLHLSWFQPEDGLVEGALVIPRADIWVTEIQKGKAGELLHGNDEGLVS